MDSKRRMNLPGVRDVVCMFCTWTWLTGTSPDEIGAKCPKCGYKGGVEAFMVVKPGIRERIVVTPQAWQL